MCKYCNKQKNILLEDEIVVPVGWENGSQDTQVIIETRNNITYLRMCDKDDKNCLDNGAKIEIKFCPMCGRNFKGE